MIYIFFLHKPTSNCDDHVCLHIAPWHMMTTVKCLKCAEQAEHTRNKFWYLVEKWMKKNDEIALPWRSLGRCIDAQWCEWAESDLPLWTLSKNIIKTHGEIRHHIYIMCMCNTTNSPFYHCLPLFHNIIKWFKWVTIN